MASHRAWLSAAQLSRQFLNSARYVRPNSSVVPDNPDRQTLPPSAVSSLLPLFTCVPPPPLPPACVKSRALNTTLPHGKKYRESENEFAHDVMANLPGYARTLHYHVVAAAAAAATAVPAAPGDSGESTGWASRAAHSLLNALGRLSMSEQPASPESLGPDEQPDEAASRCNHLSDSQIVQLLAALLSWPPETSGFRRLWCALDAECCRRLGYWEPDQTLLVADLWYKLNLSRITRYSRMMLIRLGRQLRLLTPTQLVQYLFYVNLERRLYGINEPDLERKILECLPMLSIDELGIICMSFFKTQTPLQSDELVDAVVVKLLQTVESAKPEAVCAVLKLLRLSVPARRWQVVERVYKGLLPLVSTFNSLVQLHLLLLGTQTLVHVPAAVVCITAHLHGQLSHIRLKDIERMLFATMLFNFDPGAAFFRDVVEELRSPRRSREKASYPKSVVSCLLYLAYHGVYPADLAAAVVSPATVANISDHTLKNYGSVERELVVLDCTLELELPGYSAQLPQQYQRRTLQKNVSRLPVPGMQRATFWEANLLAARAAIVQILGGEDRVAILHVLPHFVTPDLVVCLDARGGGVPLPAAYLCQPALALKRPLPAAGRWCCVVVGGRSSYTRNLSNPVGNFLMRMRQLRHVGYSVIEVPWFEFRDRNSQVAYLRRKLQQLPQEALR